MVLYRVVFQAKFGQAADLVKALKGTVAGLTAEQKAALQPRILTDISGEFDTVVLETSHESLAALEQFRLAVFAQSAASDEPDATAPLIAGGRNEYYTIEL